MGPIIDLTYLFPWRFLFLFCCSVVFSNIYRSILKDRINPLITFLIIFAIRVLTSVIFYNNDKLNMLGYPVFALLCFIVLIFLTEGKLYDKFFVIILWIISYFSASGINAVVTVTALGGKSYEEIFGTENFNLTYLLFHLNDCIITLIMGILFANLLKLYKQKRSSQKTNKLLIYFSFFPITHILTVIVPLMTIPIELDKKYLSTSSYISMYILIAIIMIFDCSFPLMINYFEKIIEQNNEYEKNILKNTMDYNQMLMLKQEKQEFRKIKHDFANIITTAKGFIEINKPEKALNILSNTNEDLMGLAGFSVCSNETINTILYIKQQSAEKNNIKLDIEIKENCAVLIDDYDLCRLLHNIIDNALNAVLSLTDRKYCKIFIEINNEKLLIKTENKFNNSEKKHNNKKSTEHGNGTGIIKNIVSKYNGRYVCNQLNSIWYVELSLDNKKAENCTPKLGR